MPIIDRIDAFAYLDGFLATVAMLLSNLRAMEATQCLQPLKASLKGVTTLGRDFCPKKRKAAEKMTFTRRLGKCFNETVQNGRGSYWCWTCTFDCSRQNS